MGTAGLAERRFGAARVAGAERVGSGVELVGSRRIAGLLCLGQLVEAIGQCCLLGGCHRLELIGGGGQLIGRRGRRGGADRVGGEALLEPGGRSLLRQQVGADPLLQFVRSVPGQLGSALERIGPTQLLGQCGEPLGCGGSGGALGGECVGVGRQLGGELVDDGFVGSSLAPRLVLRVGCHGKRDRGGAEQPGRHEGTTAPAHLHRVGGASAGSEMVGAGTDTGAEGVGRVAELQRRAERFVRAQPAIGGPGDRLVGHAHDHGCSSDEDDRDERGDGSGGLEPDGIDETCQHHRRQRQGCECRREHLHGGDGPRQPEPPSDPDEQSSDALAGAGRRRRRYRRRVRPRGGRHRSFSAGVRRRRHPSRNRHDASSTIEPSDHSHAADPLARVRLPN